MSLLKQRHNGNAVDMKVLTAYPNCGGLQNMGSVPDSSFPARVWLHETFSRWDKENNMAGKLLVGFLFVCVSCQRYL